MKVKVLCAALMSGFSLMGEALEKGADLPRLEGVNQDGEEVVIEAAEGHEWLLIFTYPKALTGG